MLRLSRASESPVIAIALAKTLRELGESAEAVRTLQEYATRQAHPGWDVLSLEGILEDEQGHHSTAEKAHRAAIAAAPDQSDLHNNLGYNLLTQGSTDAAIEEFRQSIELDPKSDIAHNNLAAALARSGSREAVAEWSRSNGQAEAHSNMAAVLIDQRRYDEARAELAAALKIDPNSTAALANLRLVAEKDGRPATIPARATDIAKPHVSLWARILGRRTEYKTAARGSGNETPVNGAEANAAPADTLVKK